MAQKEKTIENYSKFPFIREKFITILNSNFLETLPGFGKGANQYFMGANERNFNWLWTDKSLFEFNNWAKDRPDNNFEKTCLRVYGSNYTLEPLEPGYNHIKEHKNGEWDNIICDIEDNPGPDCPDAPAYHPNKNDPECVNECLPYKGYGGPAAYKCKNINGGMNACWCGGFYMCSIPLGIFF